MEVSLFYKTIQKYIQERRKVSPVKVLEVIHVSLMCFYCFMNLNIASEMYFRVWKLSH